jgi:hypothetical protein
MLIFIVYLLFDTTGISKCSGENDCPQLCFAIPEAPFSACECSDGLRMSADGKVCEKIANYTHPLACDASQFQCAKFPKCIDSR